MRLFLTVIVTLLTLAGTAEAKSRAPQGFDGKLISYQTFARLTPEKRKQYLRDLQSILVLIEKNQSKYEIAANGNYSELKEQIAFMMQMAEFMPEAAADPIGPVDQSSLPTQAASLVPSWNPVARTWVCRGEGTVWDAELGTCVLVSKRSVFGAVNTAFARGGCPDNSTALPYRRGLFGIGDSNRCIPLESWDALSQARRKELAKGTTYPENFFANEDSDFGRPYTLGGGTHDLNGVPLDAPKTEPVTPDNTPIAANPKPGEADDTSGKGPKAKQPEAAPAPAAKCKLPELACGSLNDEAKKALISDFRKDRDSNFCIAGGNFSEYRTKEKRVGQCVDVKKMRVNRTAGKDKFKECDKGQSLCNPAVFCLGLKLTDGVRQQITAERLKKGQSIDEDGFNKLFQEIDGTSERQRPIYLCADLNQNMTASCEKSMQAHIDGTEGVPGFTGDKSKYVYEQCDPIKLKVSEAIKDEWNELIKKTHAAYKTQCGDSSKASFQALFCQECKIIGERIFKANEKAIGVGCAEGSVATAAAPAARVSDEEPAAAK